MPSSKMTHTLVPLDRCRASEQEVSPGLWLCRRSFIAYCGAALATEAMVHASSVFAQDSATDFDDFLALANETARNLLDDATAEGQDRYLRTVSAHASGLVDVPLPETWRDSGQSDGPGTFIGVNPGGVGFVVLHWRMEPGSRILPHAHTYGNVVTIGLEGAVRVRNYEVVGERDYLSDSDMVVRRSVDQLLGPGDTNLVSLERNYVHGFDATAEGGRGLDITSRLLPRPDHGVPYLELGEELDAGASEQRYRARWRRQ